MATTRKDSLWRRRGKAAGSNEPRGAPNADRGGITSIDAVLRAFVRTHGLSRTSVRDTAFLAWKDAVGDALNRRARPVRFDAGKLIVEVDSAAHLQELTNFTGEDLRLAANARAGKELIERVVFQLKR